MSYLTIRPQPLGIFALPVILYCRQLTNPALQLR